MPNWCSTSITFFMSAATNNAKASLNALHDALRELGRGPSLVPNGFGSLWEGNVCEKFGLNYEEYRCRGSISWIEEFDEGDDAFQIDQEDAWGPNVEFWREVIDGHFPGIDFVYKAEEPGCEIFINSDTTGIYYPERYLVDYYPDGSGKFGDPSYDYYDSEEEMLAEWSKKTGEHFLSADDLVEFAHTFELIESEYLTIHKFETV